MAMIAAHAAWHMGAWEDMRKYVAELEGIDVASKVRVHNSV
jgi:FKBP12-rapamycin complex-associated protein